MTDKFSPPRHNKAAHSALSSLFFFPSPSPLLFPSYPCVSVSSSQPSTPSRLPPLLRHKTSPSPSLHLDPFTGTNSLQIAPGNLISTFPISWEPILAEKKNYTGVTNWHEPCIRDAQCRVLYDSKGMLKGSIREGGSRREWGCKYADEVAEEVTLFLPLTYRDHFVDMVDVLENCSLPGLTRF